jgi:pyruvate dehydrogenase E2 component (dihydrolipoamide acetyltransferase)
MCRGPVRPLKFILRNDGLILQVIIDAHTTGIGLIGAARDVPAIVNGETKVQSRMRVTMSCDHRAIDGAVGARFLQTLRQYLEQPFVMLY